MAKQVLIIEDDDAVGKAIAEVCSSLGEVQVTIAKNGAAALDKLAGATFDLITLDILLPGGMDGYKVAEAIRNADPKVPIVVMSGFVKDPKVQKDLQTKYEVKAILQKPLKPDDIRAALGPALGLRTVSGSMPALTVETSSARVGSFQLSLFDLPAPMLFGELFRQKAEGVLDLTKGTTKKRFYFQRGFLRYATSNVKAETIAGILATKGVPEAKIAAAMQKAKDEGLTLTDALVESRVLHEKDATPLLVAQTEEVAMTAVSWNDGQAAFRAQATDSGPEGRANPVLCVLKGVKRAVTADQAKAALRTQGSTVPERTPELDRELFAIRALFAGEAVIPAINGKATVAELLGRAKDVDAQLLHGLLACGLARAKGAVPFPFGGAKPVASSTPGQPMPAVQRPVSSVRHKFTADEEAVREQIFTEQKRLAAAKSHYQVLGLPPTADAAAVKTAYFRLARTWHADAFAGMELGDAAPALEEIFKRVSEANKILSDTEERVTYDHVLSQQAKGIPTDPEQIMQAESTFNRGESARKAGRLKDAEKLYREAISIYPANASYLYALATAVHQLKGKAGSKECLDLLDKALSIKQDFLDAMFLRGQLLLESGDAKQALELARKITSVSAGYPGAMDLIRAAKQQMASGGSTEGGGEKGGLFGKLFGGKK